MVLLTGIVFYLGYKLIVEDKIFASGIEQEEKEEEEEVEVIIPKLKIYDIDSNSRPIAIIIDNNVSALPHVGLQEAYLMYEIVVEGGITRLLALYRDSDASLIGPVRSARHYYLDYALENDAVFVHFGHSPKTLTDVRSLKVNNINGIYESNPFWRDSKIKAPHNVFTSIKKITETIENKKYRYTSDNEPLLNYSIEEISLANSEDIIAANMVEIRYSTSHYSSYEYDEEQQVYLRSMKGKPHIDKETAEQYTFKNIIVYSVRNFPLIVEGGGGRQDLSNVGEGKGHYITNGYAIPITWEKSSRGAPTIYKDMQGELLKVNDGNTFIHLQPLNQKLTIE